MTRRKFDRANLSPGQWAEVVRWLPYSRAVVKRVAPNYLDPGVRWDCAVDGTVDAVLQYRPEVTDSIRTKLSNTVRARLIRAKRVHLRRPDRVQLSDFERVGGGRDDDDFTPVSREDDPSRHAEFGEYLSTLRGCARPDLAHRTPWYDPRRRCWRLIYRRRSLTFGHGIPPGATPQDRGVPAAVWRAMGARADEVFGEFGPDDLAPLSGAARATLPSG